VVTVQTSHIETIKKTLAKKKLFKREGHRKKRGGTTKEIPPPNWKPRLTGKKTTAQGERAS